MGIKALLEARDYANAQTLASNGVKIYADTPSASEFAPLLKQAQDAIATQATAQAQAQAAPTDEKTARHNRFLAARDAGLAAMNKQDYPTAITQFQAALNEENDPETQGLLQHAALFVGKPRLAVAEFSVVGDVGIPDAGKAVSELMLARLDPQRFQVVDRAWLDSILAQQGLTPDQIAQTPALLRARRVDAIRYIVVGTVSRLGALTVSAQLVDVWTGQAVQTAEVTAADPAGLQNSLSELTAILQMTNEEKANYLAFRQRQTDAMTAVDPAAQAAAQAQAQAALEAQRQQMAQQQAASFAQAQHEREAAAAINDIRALFAQADFGSALRYIQWARPRYNDTSVAQELAALEPQAAARYQEQAVQQQNAAAWAQQQQELAARHQRFLAARDQGLTAFAAGDLVNALSLLQAALNEEDDPNVRATLDVIVRRMQRPGIAVLDFDVRGDIGMDPRQAPRWLASLLLSRFDGDASPFRTVRRDELHFHLRNLGLTIADVQRNPFDPRLRLLREQVRFLIVGTASHGSVALSTVMIDLAAGRPVQTAEFIATDIRALPESIAQTAIVLQMTNDQKDQYIAQLQYANWMSRGDTAAQAPGGGDWEIAYDAYAHAYRIMPTDDALAHMSDAAHQVEDRRHARHVYDEAWAAAEADARANRWKEALDHYHEAFRAIPTDAARAAIENARAKYLASVRDRRELYATAMANGDNFAKANDWDQALDAYKYALSIEQTDQARTAVARTQRIINEARQAKDRDYAAAMAQARSAIEGGNWQKALDAFTRAAAIKDTREAANGIANARTKLAEAQANQKRYDDAMKDAAAAARIPDWDKALAAHQRAAAAINTPEVQRAIDTDKREIAAIQRRDQQKLYDAAMTDANTHVQAGQWQDALDAYKKAYEINKTKEAAAGIAQANKMIADAAYNKKQYDKAMADAAAAARTNDWQKALAAYQQALAIDPTAEAKAGVDNANKQIAAAAAAAKQRQYNDLMTQAQAAANAGDWKKALGLFTKAQALDNTPDVQAAIANAQKKIADAETAATQAAAQQREFDALLAAGNSAARANDWQKALDSFTKAAALKSTPEVQTALNNAKAKLAAATQAAATAAEKKKQYDDLMAQAAAAGKAGNWQQAVDAYTKAQALDNTTEVRTALIDARRQLTAANAAAAALEKKKQYDALMAQAVDAGKTGDWQKALDTYNKAQDLTDTPEVRTAIADAKAKLAAAKAAAAAAEKKKQYDDLMAQGAAAVKINDWQKALDAYNKAQDITDTPEVKAAITDVKAKLAAAAAAQARQRDFARFMNDGAAAARTNDWQRALDAYTKAQALNNTPEVQAAIDNAKKKLAEAQAANSAAAEKKRQYDAAMAEATAAARTNDWQKALDAYTKAAAIDNTREAQTGIDTAKRRLATAAAASRAAAEEKKQFDDLMAQAAAAAQSNDWQKAVDTYAKAQDIDNTPEVRTALTNARRQLAAIRSAAAAADAKKRQYTQFMTAGDNAARANDWQKAIDNYTKAQAIDNTPEVQSDLDNAKKKLADASAAADKKREYDKLIREGDAEGKSGDWLAAIDKYKDAAAVDNTAAVQSKITNATNKLFDKYLADGKRAASTGNYQTALDLFDKARAIKTTPELETAITNAKKKVNP
jgi:tetratricopeptide (TPR) repeat protein